MRGSNLSIESMIRPVFLLLQGSGNLSESSGRPPLTALFPPFPPASGRGSGRRCYRLRLRPEECMLAARRSTAMNRAVIVICDSLRTDLITQRDAPFLTELGQRSARFASHAGVFPSTTRTSAASIATGCLPARHGLLGNTMALDEGDGLVCLSVGRPDFR